MASLKYRKLFFLVLMGFQLLQGQLYEAPISPPLKIPIALSGTFAELRSSHFHAGLDIKTQGRQGLGVYGVWDGYISRILVSTNGYGKAIYITHPNGLVSVYAHLKKFAPKIEAYVKNLQYQKESFTLQTFPKKDALQIDKGELIAYSGNTGGSFGPHLHFELREEQSQHPVNPLLHGIEVEDQIRPQLRKLFVFNKRDNDSLRVAEEISLNKVNDSLYVTRLIQGSGSLGFGLQLFDRQDRSWNKNGVYALRMNINGQTVFGYRFDAFSFQDSKGISQLIDYKTYVDQGTRVQKLFDPLFEDLSFIEQESDGFVNIEPGKSYQLLIEVEDFAGNTSYIETYIEGTTPEPQKDATPIEKGTLITPDKDYLFNYGGIEVYFPRKSLYRPHQLFINARKDTLFLDRNRLPIRNALELQFHVSTTDSLIQRQSFIALLNKKNKPGYVYTYVKEGHWKAKTKTLGTYIIARDSVAPQITPVNFKPEQWLSKYRYLKLKISDDFSGIRSYKTYINGQWARFEYEPKDGSLTYDFEDQKFEAAQHDLRIEVEDNSGNTTQYETVFFRKY